MKTNILTAFIAQRLLIPGSKTIIITHKQHPDFVRDTILKTIKIANMIDEDKKYKVKWDSNIIYDCDDQYWTLVHFCDIDKPESYMGFHSHNLVFVFDKITKQDKYALCVAKASLCGKNSYLVTLQD